MSTAAEAVATATADLPRFYPVNGVPKGPTYPYGVFSAMLGTGAGYTLDAATDQRNVLVVVQSFGRTMQSAMDLLERAHAALLDRRLDITGWDCTPLRIPFDPVASRDPDDGGVIGATSTLTCSATKET